MGVLEIEVRKRRRRGQIQHAVLATIGVAGVLLVAMAAPNALQLLGGFGRNKYRFTNQAKTALSRLASKRHVIFVEKNGARYARITEAGKRALILESHKFGLLAVPRRWDKRWRIIIFDIPEKRRTVRDKLRMFMQSCGFYRLQDSVWVYPHDCEDLIALLKADLKIGAAALYLIVEQVENDKHLRHHFNV